MMNEPSIVGVAMLSRKTSKLETSDSMNMKLNSKGKGDFWCSHYKKFDHIKENYFKLHGKEKAFISLVELKGQPSGKVYQELSNFDLASLLHLL